MSRIESIVAAARTGPAFRSSRRRLGRATLLLLSFVLTAAGWAQTSISVQLMSDSLAPQDFGTAYPLGQLSNDSYTYGGTFILAISYSDLDPGSLSLAFSGGQRDFALAWRVAGTSENHPFNLSLGKDVAIGGGSSASQYYRNDGTLHLTSTDATRYRIGARSTPAANRDLDLQVTLTATLY